MEMGCRGTQADAGARVMKASGIPELDPVALHGHASGFGSSRWRSIVWGTHDRCMWNVRLAFFQTVSITARSSHVQVIDINCTLPMPSQLQTLTPYRADPPTSDSVKSGDIVLTRRAASRRHLRQRWRRGLTAARACWRRTGR